MRWAMDGTRTTKPTFTPSPGGRKQLQSVGTPAVSVLIIFS